MGRKDALRRAIESYLEWVGRTLTPGTERTYRCILGRLYAAARTTRTTTYLSRWTAQDLQRILSARAHLLPGTRRLEMNVLRQLLLHAGSTVMERALRDGEIKAPPASRVNVRWYSEEILAEVRDACQSDTTYLMLVLASEVGLRRAEIAALRVSDIGGDVLIIRGKGEKYTPVPLTRLVAQEIDRYKPRRARLVREAQERGWQGPWPEELLIHRHHQGVREYHPSSIWARIQAAGKVTGIRLSPHDCRRSCGRELYLATRDIVAVSRLLRHAQLDQTVQYIGADLEDARRAMETREAKRASMTPLEPEPAVNVII